MVTPWLNRVNACESTLENVLAIAQMQGDGAQQLPALLLISRLVHHGDDLGPVLAIAVLADVAVAVVLAAPPEGVSVDALLALVADLLASSEVRGHQNWIRPSHRP